MATVTATADIRSANVRGSSTAIDIISLRAQLSSILNSTDAQGDKSTERTKKRRKLDTGASFGVPVDQIFDGTKNVVLARVELDLRCELAAVPPQPPSEGQDAPSQEESIGKDEAAEPTEVSLEAFHKISPTEFKLSLWNPHTNTPSIELIATATADILESIAQHMEGAAALKTASSGRKRENKSGAAFARCLLGTSGPDSQALSLVVEIRWLIGLSVVEQIGAKTRLGQLDLGLLSRYLPPKSAQTNTTWSLSDFYDAVHVPPSSTKISPRLEEVLHETKLYPFQQRAVDWLLRREGVALGESGFTEILSDQTADIVPASFEMKKDADGATCYVSYVRGMVVADPSTISDSSRTIRGGILAEEMGLGKTVELIALICHNRRRASDGDVFDAYTGTFVKPSTATLIITPPSILEQWKNEIQAHAPELRVLHYKGFPPMNASRKAHEEATVESLLRFDVVLTTYSVLAREVHYAVPPPDRDFRHAKQHERRTSPLMQISWWRVCLDEAQMIESGVSQAATVARIIPRCNAWAVSGTPLRKNVQDLRGLLIFLRYHPFADNKAVWERLDRPTFTSVFNQITLRHTKDKVRDELRLPPQKRVVITVPFTAIEEQNYTELIRQMCEACGMSPDGFPVDPERDANDPWVIERMREWLVRLRQTCLHAHVGKKNRKALGGRNGPLRSVHDVLEVMIDQIDTAMKSEARERILARVRCGHIVANARDLLDRSQRALLFYEQALEDAQNHVATCRRELSIEKEKIKATEASSPKPHRDEDDSDYEEEHDMESFGRITGLRKVLRSFLELEHACKFFIGTSYYQIKANEELTKPESEKFHQMEKSEVEWYDKAKLIRKELLRETQNRAQAQMGKVKERQHQLKLSEVEDLPDLGGIENVKILRMMDDVSDLLNAQAKQMKDWRQKVVDILLMPLVDEDEGKETTGDEYEDSTKVQDKLYVYVMALKHLIASRNAAINGLQDTLVDHELKEAVIQATPDKNKSEEARGHAPELVLEIAPMCRKLKAVDGSLKGVISGLRSLITSLQWRADGGDSRAASELGIVQKQFTEVQRIFSEQSKAYTELEKEQEIFRATMNQRLEFYRQLQHISDTVAPWKDELDPVMDAAAFARQMRKMQASDQEVRKRKTKYNYLVNLRQENEREDLVHECIICKDEFEIGVITSCGHEYCKECINQWWQANRNCPLCKVRLYTSDFRDINFKPRAIQAQEELHDSEGSMTMSGPSTPSSATTSIYSDMSDSTMREIKTIDLNGSYGSKVDMLARHLIWIRHNDPGAKSIIFSQFGDFLEVLSEALKNWKIGCSSISEKDGIQRFRSDPAVECFLLDAKSDSSGLTLVNATYVFLCEPLINPAIELQAIARVHRIGQLRATTVFMYLISDTVEEAIYDISVARRLEHIGKTKKQSAPASRSGTATPASGGLLENTLDKANSMELEAAPVKQLLRKKGDGEIVQADDLWSCLFGKPRTPQRAVLEKEVGRELRAEAAEGRIRADAGGESVRGGSSAGL
ncbi:hypothetical protein P154DRAFT_520043 [Amniculicola lignicola CBS 123094]|uniref:ATP-dependent DNA helicase n=1 Tax=Amniculicola lignicola CBS 123094 TaxID=1392246 RepID=A0A6A5WWG8_9PLEO|nr:hypothetical protein P154DRAFT_520043 [Amniculicola lignicola CBS 123094]